MLLEIRINNIALISQSKIAFDSGFNVLSGETGAGKSIIIDAINFVLGDRADKTLIKSGEDSARCEVVFDVDQNRTDIMSILDEAGIEQDNTIIISRLMTTNGKNECRINGQIVTLATLRRMTKLLVDIHGQFEHQDLLDSTKHIGYIDLIDEEDISKEKSGLHSLLDELHSINSEIDSLGGTDEDRAHQIDLLTYEIDEINKADIKQDEENELNLERVRLSNVDKIFENLKEITGLFGGEYGVDTNISSIASNIDSLVSLDPTLSDISTRISSAKYEILDIYEYLKHYMSTLDFEPNRLDEIMTRLDLIHNIFRKYGGSYESMIDYLEKAKLQLFSLNNCAEKLATLNERKSKLLDEIYIVATRLTKIRSAVSKEFCSKIEGELSDLGMKNCKLEVVNHAQYSRENIEDKIRESGADDIELLFSANAGVPPRPLSKIISGGELSRFMLALKCVLVSKLPDKTLIFDEIDSGIGGAIATELSKKIIKLARNYQVISVTHLPQIACFADTHYKITKYEDNGKTYTKVDRLDDDARILEIGRMLAGSNTDIALMHAKELLSDTKDYKKSLR